MFFKSTVWEEIDRARNRDPEALLRFVTTYRPAVVAFLRTQGFSADDSEDLAQEAFFDIVRHDVLSRVDRKKGRFRNLMLAVTTKVALKERRRRNTLKRGGDHATISLDESPVSIADERRFDSLWVQQLVALALRRLAQAHEPYYEALQGVLDGKSHKEIAEDMGRSPAEVNNFIHRAKGWITRNVLQLIADYCDNDTEFKAEVDHLAEFLPETDEL